MNGILGWKTKEEKTTAENQATDSTAQRISSMQAEMPSLNDCRKIA